jgi:hypothetical protein
VNFDIGDILTRASQITWRHKILWVFNMFPVLVSFLFIPVVFIPMIFLGPYALVRQASAYQPSYLNLFATTSALLALLSLVFYVVASASTSMGVLRIESGFRHQTFRDLFQDGLKYFWPILGITLLIGGAASVVLLLGAGCVLLAGAATRGLALLCLIPLFLSLYPFLLLAYCWIEQSQAALLVERSGLLPAIGRAWNLIRAHFGKFLLISLFLSIPLLLLSAIAGLPLAFTFIFVPLIVQVSLPDFDFQRFGWTLIGFSLILLPILALVQGVSMTFIKTAFMTTFLRLTRISVLQTALQ